MTRYPLESDFTLFPLSSTTERCIPGTGFAAEPGLRGIVSNPGTVEIIAPPVSVCHQVSTIGHRFFPIVSKYHFHTLGFIGSPTVPNNRKLERLCEFGISSPLFINILSAVGVVYKIVIPYFDTRFHILAGVG